jgi:hypothetical protein
MFDSGISLSLGGPTIAISPFFQIIIYSSDVD